ncbi:hypothetical protein WUBG_06039, partial [Wuchereria bancrofti]
MACVLSRHVLFLRRECILLIFNRSDTDTDINLLQVVQLTSTICTFCSCDTHTHPVNHGTDLRINLTIITCQPFTFLPQKLPDVICSLILIRSELCCTTLPGITVHYWWEDG